MDIQEKANALKLAQTRHARNKDFYDRYNKGRFQRYYRNYANDGQKRLKEKIQKKGDASWMSNITYPLTSSYIDSVLPIIKENMPTLGVRAAKTEAVEYSSQLNSYYNNYWAGKSNVYSVLGEVSQTAATYGVAYPSLRWDKAVDMFFEYKDGNENNPIGKVMEDSYCEYNDPKIENSDVFNTFPDGYATSRETRQSVSRRYVLTKEEAMKKYAPLFESGLVDGDIEDLFNGIQTGGRIDDDSQTRYDCLLKNPERNLEGNVDVQVSTDTTTSTGERTESVSEYIEVHTTQDITIYSGQTLICRVDNVFREIWIDHVCYKKPEWGIWGVGIAEDLDMAHYYINVAINQESDVATLENFPNYAYDPASTQGIDDNFMVGPSKMIPIPPDSIKELPRGGTLNLSYKLIEFLRTAAREGVGIDETTRGSQMPASTVATQINAIRESTNRRVNNYLIELADYEARLMKMVLKMGYLLYPTKEVEEQTGEIEITWLGQEREIMEAVEYIDLDIPTEEEGETFYKIKKEAFNPRGFWKFVPNMNKAIEFSREAELRNTLGFVSEMNKLLANDVVAKSLGNFDFEPIVKELVEKYGFKFEKTQDTGGDSPQDIKTTDALLNSAQGQEQLQPDMMSQLPDAQSQTMGQNLSTLNQLQ